MNTPYVVINLKYKHHRIKKPLFFTPSKFIVLVHQTCMQSGKHLETVLVNVNKFWTTLRLIPKVNSSEKENIKWHLKRFITCEPASRKSYITGLKFKIILHETYTSLTNVASGVGKADPSLLAIVAPGWKKLIRK